MQPVHYTTYNTETSFETLEEEKTKTFSGNGLPRVLDTANCRIPYRSNNKQNASLIRLSAPPHSITYSQAMARSETKCNGPFNLISVSLDKNNDQDDYTVREFSANATFSSDTMHDEINEDTASVSPSGILLGNINSSPIQPNKSLEKSIPNNMVSNSQQHMTIKDNQYYQENSINNEIISRTTDQYYSVNQKNIPFPASRRLETTAFCYEKHGTPVPASPLPPCRQPMTAWGSLPLPSNISGINGNHDRGITSHPLLSQQQNWDIQPHPTMTTQMINHPWNQIYEPRWNDIIDYNYHPPAPYSIPPPDYTAQYHPPMSVPLRPTSCSSNVPAYSYGSSFTNLGYYPQYPQFYQGRLGMPSTTTHYLNGGASENYIDNPELTLWDPPTNVQSFTHPNLWTDRLNNRDHPMSWEPPAGKHPHDPYNLNGCTLIPLPSSSVPLCSSSVPHYTCSVDKGKLRTHAVQQTPSGGHCSKRLPNYFANLLESQLSNLDDGTEHNTELLQYKKNYWRQTSASWGDVKPSLEKKKTAACCLW